MISTLSKSSDIHFPTCFTPQPKKGNSENILISEKSSKQRLKDRIRKKKDPPCVAAEEGVKGFLLFAQSWSLQINLSLSLIRILTEHVQSTLVLFLGSPMALGNQAFLWQNKVLKKISTSILCLPKCPCDLLSLRPKPKGGGEARPWKTSWKKRSPNAKKPRRRKNTISHNNDKI